MAVEIRPNGRVRVEIFFAVQIAQHRAFAGRDDNRLTLQPIAHLRERMPDVSVIELGEGVHLGIADWRLPIGDLRQRGDECLHILARVGGG